LKEVLTVYAQEKLLKNDLSLLFHKIKWEVAEIYVKGAGKARPRVW